MAIATNGGHVSRAIDFYRAIGKYFAIGGTNPWPTEEGVSEIPATPDIDAFKLNDVVALKRVDNTYLVVPDPEGTIQYRDQNWKIVVESINTTIGSTGVTAGSSVVPLTSIAGLNIGSKIRVNNLYEGKIQSISGLLATLDTAAPADIRAGAPVIGGALVEGAKYVYIECYLNYDEFPLVTYRQIGLCTGVTPNTSDVLRSAAYSATGSDEYTSLGNLEILDNRLPNARDISQRELLSMIIEF